MRKFFRISRRLLLLLAALTLAVGGALAENAGALAFYRNGANSVPDLINFRGKLNEYGFYISGISDEELKDASGTLDPLTIAAVQLVHELNPDLAYSEEGVTNDIYWHVRYAENYGPLNTPRGETTGTYKLLEPGTTDPDVSKLQTRLSNLGYDESAGFHYTADVLDEEMQRAIDAFVAANNFYGYDPEEGVSVELQELIFQEKPEPVRYTAPERTLNERVMGFLTDTTPIFSLEIPNAVLLGAGFVLLCAVVVLILRIASPGKPGASAPELNFQVEYNGEILPHSEPMAPVIEIGRSAGSFPLNIHDESVSRRHCEIHCRQGRMTLLDHSSFGTKINGELCHQEERPIKPGDVIEVGKHKITIQVARKK